MEWSKKQYNQQYEKWMPWIEDQYLYYFGKDNKASYIAKDQLGQTKVTGVEPVNKLQDSVNEGVAGQIGKGGIGQGVGDAFSKEGVNRMERGGKDEQGNTVGGPLGGATNPIVDGAKSGGSKAAEGAKGVGGYVGSFWSGGDKNEKK